MKRLSRLDRDRGAYSILYGVLLVVVVALSSILVDLTSVRADRRAAKAASDAGAVAGAGSLGITEPNPRQACIDAVRFAASSLGITSGYVTTGCTPLPDSASCSAATAMNVVPVALPKNWRVTVYWPVRNESGLMQNPSVERWTNVRLTQTPANSDGGICSRVGLEVDRTRGLSVGSALGFPLAGGARSQRSVALAEIRPGGGKVVAPLIILDRHSCNVLNVTGNGGVDVLDNGDTPGVIAVDSDATVDCNGANTTAIVVTNNSHIWAYDSPTGAKGVILSYALPERVLDSYDAVQTSDTCQPTPGVFNPLYPLCPRPVPAGARFGRGAFDVRYNCTTCGTLNTDYINQFKRYVGIAAPPFGSYTAGPMMSVPPTPTCNLPPSPIVGDIWINCASGAQKVTTSGTTVFRGGRVRIDAKSLDVNGKLVFENTAQVNLNVDTVTVPSGNCLIFNPPDRFVGAGETLTQTCDDATTLETATGYLVSQDMPPVWIRGELNVNGSMIARQTFIMQPPDGPPPFAGRLNVSTVGDRIYWSAPFGQDTFANVGGSWVSSPTPCVPSVTPTSYPTAGCFEDLSSWNEWDGDPVNSPNKLSGQSQVFVDGTWFIPDTAFTFGGGSGQSQTRAQFVALRLNLNGAGTLKMSPDADRATFSPFVIGALIR